MPPMTTVNRPLQAVHLVSMFEQMTAKQLEGALYHACASHTSVVRDLNKLVAERYLARFPRPYHRIARRGQGEWVYQLGRAGWDFIGYEGSYSKLESVKPHTIAIGDLYVLLVALERADLIEVVEIDTEPNCHVRIGQMQIMPDFFARIRNKFDGSVSRFWMELDIGSEHKNQIKDKIHRYRRAYEAVDGASEEWRVWPRVIFVVRDEVKGDDQKRKADITNWIAQVDSSSGLFNVCTLDEVVTLLTTP